MMGAKVCEGVGVGLGLGGVEKGTAIGLGKRTWTRTWTPAICIAKRERGRGGERKKERRWDTMMIMAARERGTGGGETGACKVRIPPTSFDYIAETKESSLVLAARLQEKTDALSGDSSSTSCSEGSVSASDVCFRELVERGELVCIPRRRDYIERRTDGYVEPEQVVLIGTR